MIAYRAYSGASLIMPKSRYTRVPSLVASRLPGWGSGGGRWGAKAGEQGVVSRPCWKAGCRGGRLGGFARGKRGQGQGRRAEAWAKRAPPLPAPLSGGRRAAVCPTPWRRRQEVCAHLRGSSRAPAAGAACTRCPRPQSPLWTGRPRPWLAWPQRGGRRRRGGGSGGARARAGAGRGAGPTSQRHGTPRGATGGE